MPQASDSSYAAVTRHRRPFSVAGRPPVFLKDKTWVNKLESDDLLLQHHEESVTEEEDPDAVAPAGTSSAAASSNQARLRREEGWNDLGLDTVLDFGQQGLTGEPTLQRRSGSSTSTSR